MDSQYSIGVVGAGSISRLHLDGIVRHADRYRATAICDPDERARKAKAAEYEIGSDFADVRDLIDAGAIDAAIVCTPTPVRSKVLLPLIEAGIPTLCEKPFAETYDEAVAVANRAEALGALLCFNQNFRRHFAFALAREVLRSGVCGKPLHLTQIAKGLRRDEGWRNERERYLMAVMTIHWFDGYRWLLGEEPDSVFCAGVNSPMTSGGRDTGISSVLTFPSGAVAALSESFSSYHRTSVCSLDCEDATLELSYDRLRILKKGDVVEERVNPMDKIDATFFNLDDLMQAKAEGREPETCARDNLHSMRILESAYISFAEGRLVELDGERKTETGRGD